MMKAILLAAAVAATAPATNAMASPWPGCPSYMEPGPMRDICDRQTALYDMIHEEAMGTFHDIKYDGELTRDEIKRLERKIEKLEREIETLQK